jgi:hypothetical protein
MDILVFIIVVVIHVQALGHIATFPLPQLFNRANQHITILDRPSCVEAGQFVPTHDED